MPGLVCCEVKNAAALLADPLMLFGIALPVAHMHVVALRNNDLAMLCYVYFPAGSTATCLAWCCCMTRATALLC
jgi:hypothetical protein